MSFRFPDSSPLPSTPERRRPRNAGDDYDSEHPTTTPAGPPPSSAPSFTPMGDPSPSYLKSSIGAMAGGKVKSLNFNRPTSGRGNKGPLASSIRGSTTRQPSRLSRQYYAEDEDEDDDEEDEDEEDDDNELPVKPSGTFGVPEDDTTDLLDAEGDSEDAEGEDEEDEEDMEAMMQDEVEYDIEEDLLREIVDTADHERDPEPFGHHFDENDSDIIMMTTAVNERVQKDADQIFRMSLKPRKKEYKYATLAKDLGTQLGIAAVSEPDNVLLQTEDIINRLYDEGVGARDDRERLSHTLSHACIKFVDDIWGPHAETLPGAFEEHAAKVGPSADAPDFEKAKYLATLILRIHHTPPERTVFGSPVYPALPSILFNWLDDQHNIGGDQIDFILQNRPSPASHGLFWQGAFSSLIRGNIKTTIDLLKSAGWESIKKSPRGEPLYKGQSLDNIKHAVEELCKIMELCPAMNNDSWDIRSSDWTLFRLKAKAAKEKLIDSAEGKARTHLASSRFRESEFASSIDSRGSLTGLARKAESQIPWEIYESLQSLYAILIGEAEPILSASQDWCEATIALLGWWNEEQNKRAAEKPQARPAIDYAESSADEYFLERLASCFYTATESEFHFDSTDPVEVAVVSAFEDNVDGVIGFLRSWSLPIASAVAEVAALGGWLLPPESQNLISMDSLDMEDLELLGVNQNSGPDEKDGIKDTTLIYYARSVRDRPILVGTTSKGKVSMEGWEMAVQVVGRIDSAERSEEMVRDLLESVLSKINEDSHSTVDKIWRLLNELGMINFAEDTVELFGDILSRETFRFGETLWYYALSHRPGKVRDVLNTLMSISLVESTTYPPKAELDDYLKRLLMDRATTLEQFAKQDLEAAELLGKMLSGYATLRTFYELRDGDGKTKPKSTASLQQAANALMAVIASADDNIRGGLYDDTRDAVVSEDFLLALLGEASVFVNKSPPLLTLDQVDILIKAIEDIQTVGSRVYDAADEFFKLVVASGHGVKGSSPADLLKKSTGSLGGSFMMTGSSMMASQLHQSVMRSGIVRGPIKRAWDWRTEIVSTGSSGDILKLIRLGLTKDLANLWLEQADSIIM
ncbi:hypothetical protein SLS62_011290 [Diatrype stigma]|uniref:Nuclear pore complex protein Nup85 n=1 Tax=Diatrype stigma TaxID=117547 RepID=A0AAN9U676_9PEZI